MATLVNATCSECFQPQVVELNPRRRDIACEFCSHSVPMFEKRDIDGIRSMLKQERSKTYIALAVFAAAAVSFGFHVWLNSKPDMMQISTSGGVSYSGYMVGREKTKVRILEKGAEEPITVDFKEDLKDKIQAKLQQHPFMDEDVAAAMVGDESIQVVPQEPAQPFFLFIFAITALAALVFSAIATQDRLFCEF